MNLDSELDYLLPSKVCITFLNITLYTKTHVYTFFFLLAMRLMPGINYKNDWKMINIQIGSK